MLAAFSTPGNPLESTPRAMLLLASPSPCAKRAHGGGFWGAFMSFPEWMSSSVRFHRSAFVGGGRGAAVGTDGTPGAKSMMGDPFTPQGYPWLGKFSIAGSLTGGGPGAIGTNGAGGSGPAGIRTPPMLEMRAPSSALRTESSKADATASAWACSCGVVETSDDG